MSVLNVFELTEDPQEPVGNTQPHCSNCGAFLAWAPRGEKFVVGYIGQAQVETRWHRLCRRCGAKNHTTDEGRQDTILCAACECGSHERCAGWCNCGCDLAEGNL